MNLAALLGMLLHPLDQTKRDPHQRRTKLRGTNRERKYVLVDRPEPAFQPKTGKHRGRRRPKMYRRPS